MPKTPKFIISGGGTGGHIFPAIAIANELRRQIPDCDILFVGATGKMEMEKVPAAGYEIVGLNIAGLQRRLTTKNLTVPVKLLGSLVKARKLVKRFKPDVAIGVGGYASGPLLRMAASAKVPTVIQEQNSYPGITNKLLARKANRICVAYEGMERFFKKDKIVVTGNPVRKAVTETKGIEVEARKHFNLAEGAPTVLVIGGSLGARSINNAVRDLLPSFSEAGVNLIWQTGRFYFEEMSKANEAHGDAKLKAVKFIDRMDLAYAAADVVVSRAGAISISELCLVGKPTILVPSPNVSEDHQTKNAMALVNKEAALLAKDTELSTTLWPTLQSLLDSAELRTKYSMNIKAMARPNATTHIVEEILALVR